jgi:hypothetical protein
MPQKVTTTIRRVHLITSAQAADPAAAMALVQSGSVTPHKEHTTVKTKKLPTRKVRAGAGNTPGAGTPAAFLHRVSTITITVHLIADADAAADSTAAGKLTPTQQITHTAAARKPVRTKPAKKASSVPASPPAKPSIAAAPAA